jgi:Rrf2 family iron-sulfur cluster assembly transcriptional regulator
MLSTKGRYAVMAMSDIALHHAAREPLTLQEIATRQNISLHYLEQIFLKLRQNNLVISQRGPGGGYLLSRAPEEIYIYDIITASGEALQITACDGIKSCNNSVNKCITHHLWDEMGEHIANYLRNISLSDILKKNGQYEAISA